ncbi:MAG: hypothetical protein GOMPHAMPRED_004277 [Gomphillus americanus]|uniref:Alanyl-transfer RNA synthetases family profile domain-containing protein n=1 Tax=Gomphillus americanus TaxID=1940652 RepID=A0A8H3ITD2_9LECA|nr:MAG: hypothetical protein GOMPHAMPRED_004277 [Gomphillus americanus]
MPEVSRTQLTFQQDGNLYKSRSAVKAVLSFSDLQEENRLLYKQGGEDDYVVITDQTIFHPQGGGQPFDIGKMTHQSGSIFEVCSVRMDAIHDGQVLHFGRFTQAKFEAGDQVEQEVDVEKRLLYSRYHTAGHVLGAAVRHLLEKEVADFDELKASHFPDSAACEFQGNIDGKWKDSIQQKVEEYMAAKMPVEIDWWDEDDFRKHNLERLIPDRSLAPAGEKFRVVKIIGAEVYPCGGTHVNTTDQCGETLVRKIARKSGQTRISYALK